MADGKPRSAPLPDDQEAYRGVAFERNESAEGWKRRKAQQEEITGQIMAKLELAHTNDRISDKARILPQGRQHEGGKRAGGDDLLPPSRPDRRHPTNPEV